MERTGARERFREAGRAIALTPVYAMDFILSSMGNHERLLSWSDMIQFTLENHSGCQVEIGEQQE